MLRQLLPQLRPQYRLIGQLLSDTIFSFSGLRACVSSWLIPLEQPDRLFFKVARRRTLATRHLRRLAAETRRLGRLAEATSAPDPHQV
ncbi:MAG: hypothetical protein AMJ93_08730 [Anaerolineae bacterium SM23_84]|nr:MAG: hypothetical protein AMJ93_08730 [Anaerolineae bacterium SM23_84]